jgi:malonate transporter
MFALLNVAFPVFALIFIGYGCRRRGILGPQSSRELSRFVIYLGLPALLFNATSSLAPSSLANGSFIAAFAIGMVVTFAIAGMLARRRGANTIDAIIEGLGAAYPNAGFMGLPICLLAFGQPGLLPGLLTTLMTACVLFAGAIVLIETRLHAGASVWRSLMKVGASLIRNPILIGPVLGTLLAASGWQMPDGVRQLFNLLGGAAGPCALVSLGLFLAEPQSAEPAPGTRDGALRAVAPLVALKLILQPAVTGVLVYWVMPQPPVWAACAVLMSALPIGTGPFMLAELYKRDATAMSRAILVSTVMSLFTVSALLVALTGH